MTRSDDLSPTPHDLIQFEEALEDFERQWASTNPPDVFAVVAGLQTPTDRDAPEEISAAVVWEFVLIDLECRWRANGDSSDTTTQTADETLDFPQQPLIEDYLARLPELGGVLGVTPEVAVSEYRLRRRCGEHPSAEEYRTRFPHMADDLDEALNAVDQVLRAEATQVE